MRKSDPCSICHFSSWEGNSSHVAGLRVRILRVLGSAALRLLSNLALHKHLRPHLRAAKHTRGKGMGCQTRVREMHLRLFRRRRTPMCAHLDWICLLLLSHPPAAYKMMVDSKLTTSCVSPASQPEPETCAHAQWQGCITRVLNWNLMFEPKGSQLHGEHARSAHSARYGKRCARKR